jgi:hypothetical protein
MIINRHAASFSSKQQFTFSTEYIQSFSESKHMCKMQDDIQFLPKPTLVCMYMSRHPPADPNANASNQTSIQPFVH